MRLAQAVGAGVLETWGGVPSKVPFMALARGVGEASTRGAGDVDAAQGVGEASTREV